MKKHILKNLVLMASFCLGLASIQLAHAAGDGPTAGFLGAGNASSTDVFVLSCPIGTVNVKASLNDGIVLGNEMSIQVISQLGRATTQTAPDGGGFSSEAILGGGAGSYLVTIHKNSVDGEGYTRKMDCYDNAGLPFAGTQSTQVQDQ